MTPLNIGVIFKQFQPPLLFKKTAALLFNSRFVRLFLLPQLFFQFCHDADQRRRAFLCISVLVHDSNDWCDAPMSPQNKPLTRFSSASSSCSPGLASSSPCSSGALGPSSVPSGSPPESGTEISQDEVDHGVLSILSTLPRLDEDVTLS